jgi:signal transduction histidine kinase
MVMSDPAEILVVDDDDDGRASLAAILETGGYYVREARDGRDGLTAVELHTPSLVLLDVSMPGMDGLETLRRLRSGAQRDVPVILLTGKRFDPDSIGEGLELGADEYLPKPVRPPELLARIRAMLRLHATRRELEAVKRDQTAMLVHDLKQPLAIITLRAEFVEEESTDPEVIRSGLQIRQACRQLEQLVNSVLELSRLEAGQMRLSRGRHSLDEVLADVVEQFRGLAERRGLALVFSSVPSPPIEVDRLKIVQVLQNLIGNALKFTPPGGRIDVQQRKAGDELVISVEDTGPGLSAADAARVFDKWHQTRAGRSRGGSGLGLAIARAIVEAHGGRIGAGPRTDGARGARFWFVLPATTVASAVAGVAS